MQHVEHRVGEQPPRRAEKFAQVIEKVMEHHQTHGKAAQSVHQLDAGGPFRAAHAVSCTSAPVTLSYSRCTASKSAGAEAGSVSPPRSASVISEQTPASAVKPRLSATPLSVDRAKRGFRVRGVHRAGKQLHAPLLREHGQKAQNERVAREALRHVVIAAADERVKIRGWSLRSSL